jgi:hypothetical protein
MITKFLRKRNPNTSLEFNKNFARIQVTSTGNTFVFKKTRVQVPTEARIFTETNDFLNTEASYRINIG